MASREDADLIHTSWQFNETIIGNYDTIIFYKEEVGDYGSLVIPDSYVIGKNLTFTFGNSEYKSLVLTDADMFGSIPYNNGVVIMFNGEWQSQNRVITFTDGLYTDDGPLYNFITTNAAQIDYQGDSSTSSGNITDLTGTTWQFNETINDYSIIELVQEFPGDYYEDSTTLFNISYTFDGTTYNCLHVWNPPSAERWEGDIVYNSGWNTTVREITFISGNDTTDENLLNYMKSNATLVSGGNSGEGGDDPGGGDTPSTPTIGPNAQLTEFLTGIADAIREKTGTSDPINPQDFATTIAEMQTGSDVESNPDEMLKAMVEGTMLTFNVSTISSIGSNAFANSFLIDVNLPTCTSIGTSAFVMCSNMIRFSAPLCTRLDNYAFQSCYALAHFNMPNLSYIGYGAFNNCNNFTLCSFPKCSYVGQLAFAYTKITKINLPQCTSLSTQAFAFCHNLVSVNSEDLPLITELRNTFTQCSNLTYVSLPNVTSISGAFYECSKLETAYLPNCSRLEYGAFSRCSNLINVTATACESVSAYAFNTCYKLPSISLPKCSYIGSRAFYQCSALSKLYLMSTAVVSLYNTQALSYTPMSSSSYLGYFGSIYVPASLLTSYKTATYWSVFSSRFVGV